MITRTLPRDEDEGASPRCDHFYMVLDAAKAGHGARFRLDAVREIRVGRGGSSGRCEVEAEGSVLSLCCPDSWMSSQHAVFTRPGAHWIVIDSGSRNGVSVNGKRQERAIVLDGDVVELGGTFFVIRENELAGNDQVWIEHDRVRSFSDTLDPSLAADFDELQRVAASVSPVLISGATGTGKERAARYVHEQSGRGGRFIAVNCGALPAGLVESELFGHRRGAFTGAVEQQQGLVLASDGGTLFLDEIADLPLSAQAALLRVLEEHEVRAVGSDTCQSVDLRVVAATHRDLSVRVESGDFREDLHARLSGFEFGLPNLSERAVDLGIMLGELLPKGATLSSGAARAMMRYSWPRNVRELARVAERAYALSEGETIKLAHLPEALKPKLGSAETVARDTSEDTARKAELVALLERHRGNISRIAAEMGKARTQIQRWLKRYELDASRYRK